jgi:hypothetical protein
MTTAKKAAGKKVATTSMPAEGKDPQGGLTAKGREFFKERDGSNLKPGVTGAADTPEKMKRKGSFLTRHFTNPRGPMVKDGEPTRLALSAHAWGEPVPKTEAQAKKLAAKGRKLLEQFHAAKDKAATKKTAGTKVPAKKSAAKKTAGKKASAA